MTVYLAKDEFDSAEQVLKKDAVSQKIQVHVDSNEIGTLFIKKSTDNPPRWASLFSDIVPPWQFGKNQSTGALLVIKEQGRLFLICFGQGRHLINAGCIETNFGLRTALNVLKPESIRSIDKSCLDAQPKQTREQSGEAVGLQFLVST